MLPGGQVLHTHSASFELLPPYILCAAVGYSKKLELARLLREGLLRCVRE